MPRRSNYEKFPATRISETSDGIDVGWAAIAARLRALPVEKHSVVCVECYPGVMEREIEQALAETLRPSMIIRTSECLRTSAELQAAFDEFLGDDPVFGQMNEVVIQDFVAPAALAAARTRLATASGTALIIGTGAALLHHSPTLLIYADLARWEIQRRQRRGEIGNLGAENAGASPASKYKRAYFIDWRAADRLKAQLLDRADFYLDTNDRAYPKLIAGPRFLAALDSVARRPFRLVPFFDPGPWGGQWMKEVCDLPRDAPNYAWCFDCVPEENSLLLDFGGVRIETPAGNLIFRQPRALLGEKVHVRFGAEFPIRFDFLDTWEGGNLSLQVHPLVEYIREKFGMNYTQDESYYLLDAKDDASVYLGLVNDVDREAMIRELWAAQIPGGNFPAEKYVNKWAARKHDHFLIPAGTIHCSGRNSLVLEISATPYIFTFKLWDWGRLGLDGAPRPIHLDHGIRNIQWERNADWVRANLINRIEPVSAKGWREERTGLHEFEFIETRRHWFRERVPHSTAGSVNVLNLVEGEEVVVESPRGLFDPFVVHYAETFIVPAAVGDYSIRPHGPSQGRECATIKAYIRT